MMTLLENVAIDISMNKGFSVIEAIVILATVAVLGALVYSCYKYHIAKSRQGEAKSNLIHIAALQDAYILEFNQYYVLMPIGLKMNGGGSACVGSPMLNGLGFRPRNCEKLRYQYWTAPGFRNFADSSPPRFMMRADSNPVNTSVYIWPDCNVRDLWRVYDNNRVPEQGQVARRVLENCK